MEKGFLVPNVFFLNGVQVATANQVGTFGLYESFTTTSHLSPCSTGLCGSFDSVNAQLWLYSTAHGVASYTFPTKTSDPKITLPGGANKILLATITGPIGGSPNVADIDLTPKPLPHANVDATFTPTTAYPDFFVKPAAFAILDLEQAFTNTTAEITSVCSGTGGPPRASTRSTMAAGTRTSSPNPDHSRSSGWVLRRLGSCAGASLPDRPSVQERPRSARPFLLRPFLAALSVLGSSHGRHHPM